jgi:hypothetical protein
MSSRDGFVERREDGDHVGHVQHFVVLTSEAVRVKSLDGNVQVQVMN